MGPPSGVTLADLGLDPARSERVLVVTGETAPLFDALVGCWPDGDVAALPAPPVFFGGAIGEELGRGLDAEESAWARQILDRLGYREDLADPGALADLDARERVVLARTLARGVAWVLLEEPLAPVAPELRHRTGRMIADVVGDRGVVVVTSTPRHGDAFGARTVTWPSPHRVGPG